MKNKCTQIDKSEQSHYIFSFLTFATIGVGLYNFLLRGYKDTSQNPVVSYKVKNNPVKGIKKPIEQLMNIGEELNESGYLEQLRDKVNNYNNWSSEQKKYIIEQGYTGRPYDDWSATVPTLEELKSALTAEEGKLAKFNSLMDYKIKTADMLTTTLAISTAASFFTSDQYFLGISSQCQSDDL